MNAQFTYDQLSLSIFSKKDLPILSSLGFRAIYQPQMRLTMLLLGTELT